MSKDIANPQIELKYLFNKLGIACYFKDILGSPVQKNELVKNVLDEINYIHMECLLIGSSMNDYRSS